MSNINAWTNENTGESVVHQWRHQEEPILKSSFLAFLRTKKGLFRLGVGDDPGIEAGDLLVADWKKRGDVVTYSF